MNKKDWAIFLDSASDNKRMVALHALSGVVVIGATVTFSALIALYFGMDVFQLHERAAGLVFLKSKGMLILSALAVSLALLCTRVFQIVLEARVVTHREKWFAEKIRRKGSVVGANISRASNYYGRLSSASMKAASTTLLLIISFVVMIVLLPFIYLAVVIGLLAVSSVGLYLAMQSLSLFMSNASHGLAEHGKKMAQWKLDNSIPYGDEVEKYYKSYFNRILISSIFGLTPAVFSFLFCIVMVFIQEFGLLDIGFKEVFLALILLQSYVGIMGKFFGSFVQASAFLPAIRACIEGSQVPSKVEPYDEPESF
ncbi:MULTISPECIES: hypothetical protein [Pseudomonas]|uniref:ABC transmembrane type-1 domain-containing protein n=1 Tax=Pseudomonas guariconensis TaxID=1288410 RepID=A0AAX0VSE3_9PSED|nr:MULTISPECIES: hypothetical protein [Pseudomonas]PLV17208.1 hypothetical protein CXG49_20415 [Pseudomonas guariconensis]PLV22077.1 hypothetical protein CXG53_21930 [Pseudomonas guariconensis]PLV27197.1 hypothetical protein CXG51_21925 [Pseudomonas guariconensis]URD41389.1 hypothetical protein M6G63_18330 [Pseudomonas sp. BYT-5]URK96740.1 hypothetical protein J5X93_18995 [Pseudomonas sp. BYT-1]